MSPRLLLAVPLAAVLVASVPLSATARPGGEPVPPAVVTTAVETPALYDDAEGGSASGDDPAIWVAPGDARDSIVIATAKEGGVRVYDLDGGELQSLAAEPAPRADGVAGRYNNVDIAYGLDLGAGPVDVAVVSDRYNDQLRFFAIDPAGARAEAPVYEITASGMTHHRSARKGGNSYRVGAQVGALNFGLLDIYWQTAYTAIVLQIRGKNNEVLLEQKLIY